MSFRPVGEAVVVRAPEISRSKYSHISEAPRIRRTSCEPVAHYFLSGIILCGESFDDIQFHGGPFFPRHEIPGGIRGGTPAEFIPEALI